MEKLIIKISAILITSIMGVIMAITWILIIPINLLMDLFVFFIEFINGESYYHNYIANSFIKCYKRLNKIYGSLIDINNFKD